MKKIITVAFSFIFTLSVFWVAGYIDHITGDKWWGDFPLAITTIALFVAGIAITFTLAVRK